MIQRMKTECFCCLISAITGKVLNDYVGLRFVRSLFCLFFPRPIVIFVDDIGRTPFSSDKIWKILYGRGAVFLRPLGRRAVAYYSTRVYQSLSEYNKFAALRLLLLNGGNVDDCAKIIRPCAGGWRKRLIILP